MQVTPRVYQKAAIKAALEGLRGRPARALVVLATGLGKTLTAAFIAKEFLAKRVLFLVHSNFILEHAVDEFHLVFPREVRMAIYNGMSKEGAEESEIVFATWQTMGKSLEEWARNHFDLVIVDEAHHSEADTFKPVLKHFTGPKLGITATPDREDKADIRRVFGPEVINITLEEAIARGWLPRIEYHVITDESLDDDALQKIAAEIREGKKRFTMAEVNRRIFIKKRDEEVARIINGYSERAVVFCASIPHAERLARSLELAQTFHSQKGNGQKEGWEQNRAVLEGLRNGTVRRVCAVNAFNEGVNVPSVGLVAFCRVTGALTIFRQQLGRGLRPGKDKLIVLDFVGNLDRIQMVLNMMNRISDLHERYASVQELSREGYSRRAFEVSGKGFEFTFSDRIVDLMGVLEHVTRSFYPTWQEAGIAASELGVTFVTEYRGKYKLDPRLPCEPREIYPDFPGWTEFLGRQKKKPYRTWREASVAAKKLGCMTIEDYQKKYKLDPRLPYDPQAAYSDFPSWLSFLGKGREFYPDWQTAGSAAIKLGIKTQPEYKKKYKKDSRLPSSPRGMYPNFPGFRTFLSKERARVRAEPYATWQEAVASARKLGIKSTKEYKERYIEDPKLPSKLTRYPDFPGFRSLFD